MKKLILAAVLGTFALLGAPSYASNATDNVSVGINLTPICPTRRSSALTFNYTSFQAGASTASGGAFTIKCTTSLPYKVGFDSTDTPVTTKSVSANASNLQLGYSLGLSGTTTGTGTCTTAISLSVTGSMA